MSLSSALYNLIVGPLELFFEVIFAFSNRIIDNPALSIIFLSLTINVLVLPLYKKADEMQAEERETEKKLEYWEKHIKKTFKGDERFMMLQTYYRQNNYKPTYVLKGSVSLFLQIPFFIAAYNFLSTLPILNGCSFWIIKDLGAPDGLIQLFGYSINLLPILMTVINIISSAIYTKDASTKTKVQLYVMAAFFLVFLYTSPSGLVFYWTLNNLFSLFKNVFNQFKNPKLAVSIFTSICSVILIGFITFIHPMETMKRQIVVTLLLLMLNIPLIHCYFENKFSRKEKEVIITKKEKLTFYLGVLFLTVLCGAFIPSTIISTSPEEFINLFSLQNPIFYVLNSILVAAGIFVVWFNIFYALASNSGKRIMSYGVWALAGVGLFNYLFFGKNYGNLSPELKYDVMPVIQFKEQLINLCFIAFIIVLLYWIWKKKEEIVRLAYCALIIGLVGTTVMNSMTIYNVSDQKISKLDGGSSKNINISLSDEGKNVVVIMLDRGIGAFVPYIFHEKPELVEKFSGFTFYPNTISYGRSTNFGTPALFGGYEYTPEELNKRDKELLKDKHNESLKVMPVLFDRAGFDTTVCDPTYAGYDWIPDLSIYDDYPEIKKYITKGKFGDNAMVIENMKTEKLNRNFFMYSIFRMTPLVFQRNIYNKGQYNNIRNESTQKDQASLLQTMTDNKHATGLRNSFMSPYHVLENMPNIFQKNKSTKNTFVMMTNDSTHEPMLLQEPSYTPSEIVNNTQFSTDRKDAKGNIIHLSQEKQIATYHVNVASLIQLGNWFDTLKERRIYDNTRIIITSDHGYNLYAIDDLILKNNKNIDALQFNPIFMVKDFNETEFKIDEQFMTNADVPTIAMQGLISNPINPFTNKPINSKAKEQEQHILFSTEWNIRHNCGTKFKPGTWLSVKDNIFDRNNWKIIKEEK